MFILCKEKLETWLVSPASRKYFGTKPITFLSRKFTKKTPFGKMNY